MGYLGSKFGKMERLARLVKLIEEQGEIQLTNLSIGHHSLPGVPAMCPDGHLATAKIPMVGELYPVRHKPGALEMTDGEIQ